MDKIGKYEIQGVLGRGAMGIVYSARDPEIGRTVAIKTLRSIGSADSTQAERSREKFLKEARSAGNLRHPNIITVFEVNVQGDTPYIVMDFIEGQALDRLVAQSRRLEVSYILSLLEQIARGLDAAHAKGVIHCDLKPSNLIVDASSQAFILDFGIAKFQQDFESESEEAKPKKGPAGTPGYMSPEQILNEALDARSDLFSFAIVAFEVFSGHRPFDGKSLQDLARAIVRNDPLSLRSLCPEFPDAVEKVFAKALAKRADKRYANAAEFVSALREAFGDLALKISPQAAAQVSSSGQGTGDWRSLPDSIASQVHAEQSRSARQGPREDPGEEQGWETPQQPSGSGGKPRAADAMRELITSPATPQKEAKPAASQAPPSSSASSSKIMSPLERAAYEEMERERQKGQASAFSEQRSGAMFVKGPVLATNSSSRNNLLARGLRRKKYDHRMGLALAFVALTVLGIFFVFRSLKSPSIQTPTASAPGSLQSLTLAEKDTSSQEDVHDRSISGSSTDLPMSALTSEQIRALLSDSQASEVNVLAALREVEKRGDAILLQLAARWLSHSSYLLRVAAIQALSSKSGTAYEADLRNSISDADPLVRKAAAEALGKTGTKASVPFMLNRYDQERNNQVKEALRAAIEKINGFPLRR